MGILSTSYLGYKCVISKAMILLNLVNYNAVKRHRELHRYSKDGNKKIVLKQLASSCTVSLNSGQTLRLSSTFILKINFWWFWIESNWSGVTNRKPSDSLFRLAIFKGVVEIVVLFDALYIRQINMCTVIFYNAEHPLLSNYFLLNWLICTGINDLERNSDGGLYYQVFRYTCWGLEASALSRWYYPRK